MKKIFYRFILLAFIPIILSAFTCNNYPDHEDESHHYKIYLENCWDKPIVVWSTVDYSWYKPSEMYYPYNILWRYDNEGIILYPGRINGDYIKNESFYEDYFEDGDSLYIAVYDSDRINKKDSLRFLVSYLLSLNDLQKVNFHITYPPSENMKDMHMLPSYDDAMMVSRQTR